jgi:hypothetical protein
MALEEIQIKQQRALVLLLDMAHLLEVGEAPTLDCLKGTFARSAATSAAVFLECVANSCLLSLALPAKLADEIDRLPTLSKLDYYLFALNNHHLDRGCRESELAGEVLKLRDYIVHSKPTRAKIVGAPPELTLDYGSTNSLKIPYDVRTWDQKVAKRIAASVVCFAKKYFIEWCRLDKGMVTSMLLAYDQQIIQGEVPTWVFVSKADLSLITKHLAKSLDFLDLRDGKV